MRVVIPSCLQVKLLEVLHSTHIGTSRMKSLARQFVWWPKLDRAVAPVQYPEQNGQNSPGG